MSGKRRRIDLILVGKTLAPFENGEKRFETILSGFTFYAVITKAKWWANLRIFQYYIKLYILMSYTLKHLQFSHKDMIITKTKVLLL